MQVREQKRKPKLGDILKLTRGQPKELVLRKLAFLYEDTANMPEEEDAKFDMLSAYFNDIKKLF
jgi:hypothetical protein